MQRRLLLSILLTAVIVGGGVAGYFTLTFPGAPLGPRKSVVVIDSAGRMVEIPYKPKTVILNPTILELLKALSVEPSLIIGIDQSGLKYGWLMSELGKKEVVGRWWKPNYEKIIALRPELVICYTRWPGVKEVESKLNPAGIKVVAIDGYVPMRLRAEIMILGRIYGREDRAIELWSFWENYLNLLESRIKSLKDKPKVYFEGYRKWRSVTAANPGGWNIALEMAGGVNIAALLSTASYVDVNPEWIVVQNPDLIIKVTSKAGYTWNDSSGLEEVRSELMSRPELATVKAIKNGAVYVIEGRLSSGPSYIIAALWYAKWLYPELFKDIDPSEAHKRYFEKFLGLEYKGCWVYPREE